MTFHDEISKMRRGDVYESQRETPERRVEARHARRIGSTTGRSGAMDSADRTDRPATIGGRPEPEASRRHQKLGDVEDRRSPEGVIGEAERRGDERRKQLVEASRPYYSVEEMADQLGWSVEAVEEAVEERRVHYVYDDSGEVRLPAWQLRGDELVGGLERVLEALRDYGWVADLIFFESEHSLLDAETPAEALLKGRVDDVLRCAAQAWRHGAV